MDKQEYIQSLYEDSRDMADGLSKLGRQIVLAIIAGSWTLSYSHSEFCPSVVLIWSLAFAFIYLFFDLLYYLIAYFIYHNYVHFKEDESKMELDDTISNTIKSQAKWDRIGSYWIIGKSMLFWLLQF